MIVDKLKEKYGEKWDKLKMDLTYEPNTELMSRFGGRVVEGWYGFDMGGTVYVMSSNHQSSRFIQNEVKNYNSSFNVIIFDFDLIHYRNDRVYIDDFLFVEGWNDSLIYQLKDAYLTSSPK